MKKILILLLVVSSAAYSQKVTQTTKDIAKILVGKTWVVDYGTMNGLKIEKLGDMKKMTIVFRADNSYTINGAKPGIWQHNAKNKSVELLNDNIIRSRITTLQAKKFTMILIPDKNAPKGIKDMQIFFKTKG